MNGLGKHIQQGSELARRSPPSYEQRMYAPHSIAAIVAELVKEGGDATVVLEGAGLANSQLNAQTTRISYRQLDIVIRNALRLSSDPAIAGVREHLGDPLALRREAPEHFEVRGVVIFLDHAEEFQPGSQPSTG